MNGERIHFVTGRLAEHALRGVLAKLATQVEFDYSVQVLPISVAALMTPRWIARHIELPANVDRVLVTGYCRGDLRPVEEVAGVPVQRGPKDVHGLAEFFGQTALSPDQLEQYDIEIIAEINHAPQLCLDEIVDRAERYRRDGADVIDVGCDPGRRWDGVGECVAALCDAGHRVSIDSFDPVEVEAAIAAGAELVLSVNASNRDAARDWGCEVVAIPDDVPTLGGLDETIERLTAAGVPLRIDPILEPIGLGLAQSIGRYVEVRRRYGEATMMMGIGNLTEMTDADSAAINLMLLGICQELSIGSVLTTEVINWARSSVRECDVARRLVRYAVEQRVPAKRLDDRLVMLRDAAVHEPARREIAQLAEQIKDKNYRLLVADGRIHLVGAKLHLTEADPFLLFQRLLDLAPANLDATHAFYLGFELAKAATALTLGKQYRQDESLDWGLLTHPEEYHRIRRPRQRRGE